MRRWNVIDWKELDLIRNKIYYNSTIIENLKSKMEYVRIDF